MPSPTSRTVPTSARSVSTSNSSILFLRIDVISSGRSFKASPLASGDQFFAELNEPAADAPVQPHRACLEDEAADEVGVDPAARLDSPAGRLLDLLHDLVRFLVRELDRGRELELEYALLARQEALPFTADVADLRDAALLDEDAQEVEKAAVGALEDVLEGRTLRRPLDLRVAEEAAQLGRGLERRGEVVELRADLVEDVGFLGGGEKSLGVD